MGLFLQIKFIRGLFAKKAHQKGLYCKKVLYKFLFLFLFIFFWRMQLLESGVSVIKYILFLQVAHLPDKANNYLTPALSVLEKNT